MTPSQRISRHFFQHTQLQLRSFYSRFTHNPWRPVVLFCGDLPFAPYNQHDKKIFLASDCPQSYASPSEGFKLLIEDFQELPFFDGGVDTLICYFNKKLPHPSVLYEFHRILSPRGKLILTVNNRYSPYYFFKEAALSDKLQEIEHDLELYDFTVINRVAHSFYPPKASAYVISTILRANRFLKKYFKGWANQYSFVCVKKSEPYDILPSYAKLTQQIPLNWGVS